MVLAKSGIDHNRTPIHGRDLTFVEEKGGRHTPFFNGYRLISTSVDGRTESSSCQRVREMV